MKRNKATLVKIVNKALCGRVLMDHWKESLEYLEECIMFLHGKYSLSITPNQKCQWQIPRKLCFLSVTVKA